MPTLSRADLRFCELADKWRDICGWIAYSCEHGQFSSAEQAHFHVLASNLLDEIRKRRSDLDLRALAYLSSLDFANPPRDGSLELTVRDATDLVIEVYTELTTGKSGEHIALSRPKLRTASPSPPVWRINSPPLDASGNKNPEAPASESISAESRALAIALAWVKQGKPLRVAKIATEAGCSASYLHRCKPFKDFLATLQTPLPRGSKDRDTGNIEAWDEND